MTLYAKISSALKSHILHSFSTCLHRLCRLDPNTHILGDSSLNLDHWKLRMKLAIAQSRITASFPTVCMMTLL